MMRPFPGFVMPPWETLVRFHPQFALAIAEGVPCRTNGRPLSVAFNSTAVGQPIVASFAEPIGSYSIFCYADWAIDPTNAFPGNALKYLSDASENLVTGVTLRLQVRGEDDWDPLPDDTPLQKAPGVLAAAAGMWKLERSDNVKAYFTLQTTPIPTQFTAWLILTFACLGPGASQYMCLTREEACKRLRNNHGCPVSGPCTDVRAP